MVRKRKKEIKKLKRKIKKLKKKKKKKRKKKIRKIKQPRRSTSGELVFKVPKKWSKSAYIDKNQYEKKYKLSIKDNEGFWSKEGKRIDWIKPYKKIKDVKYSKTDVRIKWFYDGTLNASVNCIDRHLRDKKNKQQLFGSVITLKILNKLATKNFIETFVKLLTV